MTSPSKIDRILVIRTDRLGDVVLSTPVLTALRDAYPDSDISMMVTPYTRAIVEHHPALNAVIIDDALGEHEGVSGFIKLVRDIHRKRFDAVLLLHPTARLAMACRLAGVPVRIGTGYRFYSFLFNRRVYEHRKEARRHESAYNLSLVQELTGQPAIADPEIRTTEEARKKIHSLLCEWGLSAGRFIIIHPGSGGSARDWPVESYSELSTRLMASDYPVVITGGKTEGSLVDRLVERMPQRPITIVGELTIEEMVALLELSALCITNSTGPLHMAAAVDSPTVALFCPITSCSPVRWGPYGQNHKVFQPDVPACPRCIEEDCPYFDCMSRISVDAVHAAVLDIWRTADEMS